MEISNITRALTDNVEATFPVNGYRMFLSEFDEPTPTSPYYQIYFDSILSGDYDLGDCDCEAFGDSWTDKIKMRVVKDAVLFGVDDGEKIRWFRYQKHQTIPQSVLDPECPEYEDINRYNDLIDYIMAMFSRS
jgi:hypothetical protein